MSQPNHEMFFGGGLKFPLQALAFRGRLAPSVPIDFVLKIQIETLLPKKMAQNGHNRTMKCYLVVDLNFHSGHSLSAGGLGSLLGFRLRGLLRYAFPAEVSHLPFQIFLFSKKKPTFKGRFFLLFFFRFFLVKECI
ncbi:MULTISPECIES: hypothetical protein [Peribacillus]|uniref:hypothetical protein n=1 Tax=Peribacillus frigoritolerans TaxID=450367 RepID=UPI003DA10070